MTINLKLDINLSYFSMLDSIDERLVNSRPEAIQIMLPSGACLTLG